MNKKRKSDVGTSAKIGIHLLKIKKPTHHLKYFLIS